MPYRFANPRIFISAGEASGALPTIMKRLVLYLAEVKALRDKVQEALVYPAVLIVAGIEMVAIGLLGELQVRHYYTSQHPASYTVDRLVRLASPDEQGLLSESKGENF